jgi:subtilisin family serine protease
LGSQAPTGSRSRSRPQWTSRVLALSWLLASGCASPCPEDVASFSDDPEAVRQWYMPALGVPDAWRIERGSPEVVVAVIDNGFDVEHPDLAGQVWTNDDEQENGADDDGNGYVDDVHGWDFLDRDADPGVEPDAALRPDLLAHGTAAAGVIAARTDNGVGVAGCCPGCRLMLLRGRDFRDAHDVMPVLAEAIRYAVDNGARVVSVSDGVVAAEVAPDVGAEVEAALAVAREAGVVVVASVGNDGAGGVRWPARLDSVVAVAAVDPDMRPTGWTSFGPEVDIAAPGQCIYTTGPRGRYEYFEGTSAAAPIVAGLAALLLAAHPEWGVEEVTSHLDRSAAPVRFDARPEAEGLLGRGVVDFAAALAE